MDCVLYAMHVSLAVSNSMLKNPYKPYYYVVFAYNLRELSAMGWV